MSGTGGGAARAAGLDIGSTSIKAGLLDGQGHLDRILSVPSPPARLEGVICEADPEAYLDACRGLLHQLDEAAGRVVPLGIACQRSSFLLWDRQTGAPATPLILWQDRRAMDWCRRNPDAAAQVERFSGLVLSPHAAAPKLASLREEDPALARDLDAGRLLIGTLESYLIWTLSSGTLHVTDPTMASRTCLMDPSTARWDPRLLKLFGVPGSSLPSILQGKYRAHPLTSRLQLTATIADQAAGALAVLDDPESVLVNLGTGAFVLRIGDQAQRPRGYLVSLLPSADEVRGRPLVEGTINGDGEVARASRSWGAPWPNEDPHPQAFCLPDAAGLGSPHWRSDLGFTISPEAASADPAARGRIVLEGLLFRLAGILRDLFPEHPPRRVFLAGGQSRMPVVADGLARLLDREVRVLVEPEQSLLAAARLAAGLRPGGPDRVRIHHPGGGGTYLARKHERWSRWLAGLLSGAGPAAVADLGNIRSEDTTFPDVA